MSLLDRLYEDMKKAMKAGDRRRLGVIRMTIAELKRQDIDSGDALDEAAEVQVVQKAVKQRREAAEAFAKADRPEQARSEEAEAEILEEYLPSQLSDDELAEVVKETIAAVGASSKREFGQVMGRLLAKFKGQVDGKRAKEAVAAALPDA